jgi:site-specific DNA recombinase
VLTLLPTAAYARYSSERQKATSIEDQLAMCREIAPRFHCTITREFTDEELSGSIGQRPGYQRLLDAARNREFQAIIVESQDRLWRDQGEMHHALKRLKFWGSWSFR